MYTLLLITGEYEEARVLFNKLSRRQLSAHIGKILKEGNPKGWRYASQHNRTGDVEIWIEGSI
jgi:hypothetical protein